MRLSKSESQAWNVVSSTAQKWSFPLKISSVNVTKSDGHCGFGHIYWRNPQWKTLILSIDQQFTSISLSINTKKVINVDIKEQWSKNWFLWNSYRQRCQLLENKFGWNLNSVLLSGTTSRALTHYLNPSIILEDIIVEQIQNCSNAFLFNKLTYKSLSYAATSCIHPSFLISAWLAKIVSPVSAIFCRKMSEKVNLLVKTAHYLMKNGNVWSWLFCRVFKTHGFRGGFHRANFSNLVNHFVSVIVTVFPLNFVIRALFAFLPSKLAEFLWQSLFPVCMAHGTRQLNDGSWFFQSSRWIFLTERLHTIDKTWFIIIIFYRRLAFVLIFPKNCACAHIWQAKRNKLKEKHVESTEQLMNRVCTSFYTSFVSVNKKQEKAGRAYFPQNCIDCK